MHWSIDCKIEERLESMKFISLLTVFSNRKKRKREKKKKKKMRFYRGNEYGYEISQKNGSWYHRVTWLHVVSPVLENDNEEERSTWNPVANQLLIN